MKRYQVIGAFALAIVLSANADDPRHGERQSNAQYQNEQSWQYEQQRREEARKAATEQYRDATRKQKRCFSDACRQMYGDQMNRATEEIYKNN